MPAERIYRLAAVCAVLAALAILIEKLWLVAYQFQDIILWFALAWLIAFTLEPLVDWLKRPVWPAFVNARLPTRFVARSEHGFLPHGAAVAVVYLVLLVLILIGPVSYIPIAITQVQTLSQDWPQMANRLPSIVDDAQRQLKGLGIDLDLPAFYRTSIEPQLSQFSGRAVSETLNALSTVALTVTSGLLVIVLALYISISGHSLSHQLVELFPRQYRHELLVFARTVNQNFGGFVRGQLIQSVLVGVGVAVIMVIMRLDFVVLCATLSGVFMLLPLIGVFLALIPPLVIALFFSGPTAALILFIVLFVYEQIITNAIAPKIFADSVGLHPVLIFAALLIGARIGSVWGAFFSIPIAGVMYAMVVYITGRVRHSEHEPRKE
jgi:predicted PurR-regulated permease PerM